MTIDKVFFSLALLLIIVSFFIRKDKKRIGKFVTLLALVFLFLPFILPKRWFGEWNAIKGLKGKQIVTVIIEPSSPDWKVNLTDSSLEITNRNVIDTLSKLLSKTQAYFPNHPMRIWETSIVIVTNEHDTLKLKVSKTKNNGTVVTSPGGEFSIDNLDEYLEQLTNFKEAAYSKYSKDKQ
jgi:hypothetical protein